MLLFLIFTIVTIFFIVRLPVVQNKIIQVVTHYISDKTHTLVSVGEIGISFPKTVYLKNIYIEDINKDTLLFSRYLYVNIDFFGLITNKIHISNIQLYNTSAYIYRKEGDRFYNFDFLIRAFSRDTPKPETDTTKAALDFQLDEIHLSQFSLHFLDSFGMLLADASIQDLQLKVEKTDLENLEFKVSNIVLKNAITSVRIPSEPPHKTETKTTSPLPVFVVGNLKIINSSFTFNQIPDSIFINVSHVNLSLSQVFANLNANSYTADQLSLSDCATTIRQNKRHVTLSNDSIKNSSGEIQIHLNKINLSNNLFTYDDFSKPSIEGFDPGHLALQRITSDIQNANYINGQIAITVNKFSTRQRAFQINNLSGRLAYVNKGIFLENLQLKTLSSNITGNFRIQYKSIKDLKNNLQDAIITVMMKSSTIHSSDLIYFLPQLKHTPYLSAHTATVIETEITGSLKLLSVKKLNIRAGDQTLFSASFNLAGLPDQSKLYLSMNNANLYTSNNDLTNLLPKEVLPATIRFPGSIHSSIDFNGSLSSFRSQINLDCDYGNINTTLKVINKNSYDVDLKLVRFNAGRLLRKTDLLGEMSLSLHAEGSGYSKNSIQSAITIQADDISFNNYVYHNLDLDANINRQLYDFSIGIKDTNIQLKISGQFDMQPDKEFYKINGQLANINLNPLHFSKRDLSLSANLKLDMERDSFPHFLNGELIISKMTARTDTMLYNIDTALVLAINTRELENISRSPALSALYIHGDIEPVDLPNSILHSINNYYLIAAEDKIKQDQDFEFRFHLNNDPVIQGVVFSDLKAFRVDEISGSFKSKNNLLFMQASLPEINYKEVSLTNSKLLLSTDSAGLQFSLLADKLESGPVKINELNLKTLFHDQQADFGLSTGRATDDNKLVLNASLSNPEQHGYHVKLENPVTINNQIWQIPSDNFINIKDQNFTIHQIKMKNNDQTIFIKKEAVHDDLILNFKKFQIGNLARVFNRDTLLAEGLLDGTVLLKQDESIVADITLDSLRVKSQPVGNIHLTASSLTNNKYTINSTITGNENDAEIKGNISVEKGNQTLDLIADIRKINLKSIEPFTMGQIHESAGIIEGKLTVTGTPADPVINGGINFLDATTIPAFTNNRIFLKNEHIEITDEAIRFQSVVIRDKEDHTAIVTGEIRKKGFTDFKFDLQLITKDFVFLNTTKKDNEIFYGTLLADCNAKLTGNFTIPSIHADINVKKGTYFVFAVQQNQTSTDKGEGVILFVDSNKFSHALLTDSTGTKVNSEIRGLDITANVKIDPEAVLTIIIDPLTGDSLSVKGDAALSFALDEGGKISLTGRYELTDGSYLVTLQQLIHRKFSIQKGSTITWNGDPLDADIDMVAIYKVNTSPADLIVNEVGAISEEELKSYRQRLPFEVNLILKNKLLAPDISFSIELPEAYRGAMGGVVNSKLNLLKEDPSELNKQVFALLILNRFIQQDPFTSASGSGAESVARMSVGKFLSQELNNLSAQYIKGVELNVDVQSYENNTATSGSGKTEVEIGVKKEFFKDRLSVQVGGTIDVEGAAQKSNQSNDLSGNVVVEYKLTPDGRYRLKGFRQNEYEGFIDGQLTETGVGLIYSWDFGKWKELLSPPKKDDEK